MPENNAKITDARPRKFVFNGMQLADPDPKMTPQKVAEFHSLLHAELTNVTINLSSPMNFQKSLRNVRKS